MIDLLTKARDWIGKLFQSSQGVQQRGKTNLVVRDVSGGSVEVHYHTTVFVLNQASEDWGSEALEAQDVSSLLRDLVPESKHPLERGREA